MLDEVVPLSTRRRLFGRHVECVAESATHIGHGKMKNENQVRTNLGGAACSPKWLVIIIIPRDDRVRVNHLDGGVDV